MKSLLTFVFALITSGVGLSAADSKPVTYEGKITGVVCGSCREHITAALTQRLPGVIRVDVKAGDVPDQQKLIIVADNRQVTKETATEALGTYAKNYQILSLSRK